MPITMFTIPPTVRSEPWVPRPAGVEDGGLQGDVEHEADVAHLRAGQVLQDGDQVQQLVVVRVGEPAADGDGVLRVEDVGGGRVVDDDGLAEIAADLRQILDGVSGGGDGAGVALP